MPRLDTRSTPSDAVLRGDPPLGMDASIIRTDERALHVAAGGPVNTDGPPCRLMLMNVLTSNGRKDLVLDEIRRHDPDVVVLQEVNRAAASRGEA